MSGLDRSTRIALQAPVWFVPATLADLECRHGRLDDCAECHLDERQVDEQLELELEAVR